MAQLQLFQQPAIGVSVFLPGKQANFLEIGEHGLLTIPQGLNPSAFHLMFYLPREARIAIAQKNVGFERGGYHNHALAQFGGDSDQVALWVMHDPIQVVRAGENVWTSWHSAKPNRIDFWSLEEDGRLVLSQIGVITHDDGASFRLLGELRWRGRILATRDGKLVARPEEPKWGPLLWEQGESRHAIREHPGFQRLLSTVKTDPWEGLQEEINPPLGPVPGNDQARVDWYIPFAGQKGQGIARLKDGSSAWVLGQDLLHISPDEDGIKRLGRNDLISFAALHREWGRKEGAPPKLLGVRRV